MTQNRKDDREDRAWFSSDRFFKDNDKWYFNTREGTMEGPFQYRMEAEYRLAEYIKIMNSGFMPTDSELKVEPLELQKAK
jgi:hypothetical protein